MGSGHESLWKCRKDLKQAEYFYLNCLYFSDPGSHGLTLSTVRSRFVNNKKLPHDE